MRRVGHQLAFGVEHRAGKIEPLLDVDASRRCSASGRPSARRRHEEIVEHFEQHRVGVACRSALASSRGGTCGAASGGPASRDRRPASPARRRWSRSPRGSSPGRAMRSPRRSRVAVEDRRTLAPRAVDPHPGAPSGAGVRRGAGSRRDARASSPARPIASTDDRLDQQRALRRARSRSAPVLRLESRHSSPPRSPSATTSAVLGAGIAHDAACARRVDRARPRRPAARARARRLRVKRVDGVASCRHARVRRAAGRPPARA